MAQKKELGKFKTFSARIVFKLGDSWTMLFAISPIFLLLFFVLIYQPSIFVGILLACICVFLYAFFFLGSVCMLRLPEYRIKKVLEESQKILDDDSDPRIKETLNVHILDLITISSHKNTDELESWLKKHDQYITTKKQLENLQEKIKEIPKEISQKREKLKKLYDEIAFF